MIFEPIAQKTIAPEVMRVVVRLEKAVLGHDPSHFVTHVRAKYRCGNRRMVVGCEIITDVVHQSAEHHFVVCTRGLGTGCGLQRVREATDGVALQRGVESPQPCQNPRR
jgi:hypothetical protein